ncbi:adenylate/guanylate cyclase domain-containing protein [Robertkochia sediminum]|uniref:adenylate/guanylate cyclase domain-containing protein n=1 Tax=Robertkochia sediminum TaxID=2785326 RepID=UPI0019335663|nr:adenylate/guanylate cyclase domain-containing protein [Robertkochia sediminum]MBL7473638.1 tetratricopeptide repeat protein [Robertkochia sediminum]
MKVSLYCSLWLWMMLFLVLSGHGMLCAQEVREMELIGNVSDTSDSLKVNNLNTLAFFYINEGRFQKADSVLQEAITLAKEIGYLRGEAEALKYLGVNYDYQSNRYEATRYSMESLELYKRINDVPGIANLESNLGAMYLNEGDPVAIDYLIPALQKGEALKDTTRIVSVLINLAALYGNYMQEPEKAMKYYADCKTYLDAGFEGSENWEIYYRAGLAEYNLINANYKESLQQYLALLPYDEGSIYYAETLLKAGESYEGLGQTDQARDYYKRSVASAKKWSSDRNWVEGLNKLGSSYIKSDQPVLGLGYLQEALMISNASGMLQAQRDVNKALYMAYEKQGDYDQALKHHKRYLELKDSIFDIAANDKVRFAQLNFDLEKKESQIALLERETEITELQQKRQKSVTIATVAVSGLLMILVLGLFNRYKFIKKANRIIQEEKGRSDSLLLNILPEETAQELKENGKVKAKRFESVTVMFTDFKGFTKTSENMTPEELVKSVDHFFSKFDEIIEQYGLEKIKTIGDAYMCAGGLPFPVSDHPQKVILAAIDILKFVDAVRQDSTDGIPGFEVRIGIHTGPVVAGVVGTKKFAYDIWGDTVNVASRMESSSEAGKINISEVTYALVKEDFSCVYRGEVEVKNKGTLKMYFIDDIASKPLT